MADLVQQIKSQSLQERQKVDYFNFSEKRNLTAHFPFKSLNSITCVLLSKAVE